MPTARKMALLMRRPNEVLDRGSFKFESWKDRCQPDTKASCEQEEKDLWIFAEEAFGAEGLRILHGQALMDLEAEISSRLEDPVNRTGFDACHNGSATLGRVCYLAVRIRRPDHVVETGVARGVTTAYILGALNENEKGRLHSIDLPPLAREAETLVGCAVPESLKERWQLHYGTSRQKLPELLSLYGSRIGLFVHDSLHTHSNMTWEMMMAHSKMHRNGVIIADDIECNRAFQQFVKEQRPAKHAILREGEKRAWCGIAVFD